MMIACPIPKDSRVFDMQAGDLRLQTGQARLAPDGLASSGESGSLANTNTVTCIKI